MSHIRPFKELGKNDSALAGGKGASLGEMTQASLPVPPGFVVTSEAFEQFLEETDLNVEIDSILHTVDHEKIHTVEGASEKIKALILQATMPGDLEKNILASFKKLGATYVAVRSSATSEDSASAAWAGQLDSFLNTTEKTLPENVKRCWASLFTPRAIFYRFEKGLHKEKISVAVVVQKMVESEVSGIAFSVHPVTQDYNQLIIEAGYGLGEAIVSGQITPDSYVVEKQPRRIIDTNIATQERLLVRGTTENEWVSIPQEKGNKQKLSDAQIIQLSEIILKIEQHYGFPCDIEWAFERGKFYIVQSRPITTLTEKKEESAIITDEGGVMCHAAIIARELQKPAVIGTKVATKALQDGDMVEVDGDKGIVRLLERSGETPQRELEFSKYFFLENVPGGYPLDVAYINLWHLAGPKLASHDFDAGSMYLVFEEGHYELFIEKDPWFDAASKIIEHISTSDANVQAWQLRAQKWISDIIKEKIRYKNIQFDKLSDKRLFAQLGEVIKFMKRNGKEDVELVTPNYGTNMIAEKLVTTLRDLGYDPVTTAPILYRASEDFPLLAYERAIGNIALTCYRKKIGIATLEVIKKDKELSSTLHALLEEYAWLDASIVNPPKSAESVAQDVNSLLAFGAQLEKILYDRGEEQKIKRKEKEKIYREILSRASKEQKRVITFVVTSSDIGRKIVDAIMEFIYLSRGVYTELAQRLGISEIDVRFLLADELRACLLGKKKVNMKIIEERRKLCVCFLGDQNITMITGQEAESLKRSLSVLKRGDDLPLKGEIAFSKGVVRGKAKLVRNYQEMSKVERGDVLVSSRTYPDLLPAMKRSAAIISELGGLLSHAAIVSRELNIPCVVGVKNAMSKIKDDDLLEIDTTKGTIKVLEKNT